MIHNVVQQIEMVKSMYLLEYRALNNPNTVLIKVY